MSVLSIHAQTIAIRLQHVRASATSKQAKNVSAAVSKWNKAIFLDLETYHVVAAAVSRVHCPSLLLGTFSKFFCEVFPQNLGVYNILLRLEFSNTVV